MQRQHDKTMSGGRLVAGVMIAALALGTAVSGQGVGGWRAFAPAASDALYPNPYKGFAPWDMMFEANPAIPQTLVKSDLTWRELQPDGPDSFNWEVLEDKWRRHAPLGRKFGFRFKVTDPGKSTAHEIPDWLVAKGVELIDYEIDGKPGKSPDWDSPVFLEYHDQVIKALGERYNRDPRIAWVDVGTYGFWGEWHTWRNPQAEGTREARDRILEAYLKAFPDVQLVIAFDDRVAAARVLEHGGGIRNDCLGRDSSNDWFRRSMDAIAPDAIERHYPRAMMTGEFCGAEAGARAGVLNNWESTLGMIREMRLSFLSGAGGGLITSEGLLYERAAEMHRLMGYRFRMEQGRFQERLRDEVRLDLTMRNDGVAPFYYPWPSVLVLLDASGRVAWRHVLTDEAWDCRNWLPGQTELTARVPLRGVALRPGRYTLALGIVDPETEQPGVYLAQEGRTAGGWYAIGQVNY